MARIVDFYEQLTPQALADLPRLYTPDASFKDPFNDVRGTAAIAGIFEHMFRSLEQPRFVVHDILVQGEHCFLSWDFVFSLKRGGAMSTIRGATHLRLAEDGRIAVHRDYWDAAEELYEKLPLIGALMRWLKRRVNA